MFVYGNNFKKCLIIWENMGVGYSRIGWLRGSIMYLVVKK